ncbi:S8 family peptidase [Stenotrophomonas sp. WHRI 8082]|uniref:S8 family peptidase n=1 Tax=Stenotrophomonas sp. WHRI 8082 TaxID=3162571 RepID=UPI0032EFDD93
MSQSLHPPLLALATALAAVIGSAVPSASAGEVYLQGLVSSPGNQRLIVGYRAGSPLARSNDVSLAELRADRGPLQQGRSGPLQLRALRPLAIGGHVVQLTGGPDRVQAEQVMRQIAAHPDVAYVQVDALLQPTLRPDDPRFTEQWGFADSAASINVQPAWDIATGKGAVVAVVDTGITAHPDLDANMLPGYDFISDASKAGDGDGRDDNPRDEGDWNTTNECRGSSSSWHGTHVAGTVATLTNNRIGAAGTAFNAKVLPVRVLGRCGGYNSDIVDGLAWAVGAKVSGVPDNLTPAQVINLSLGGFGTCDPATRDVIKMANANGAVVVVAAGNENIDVSGFRPANCPGAIAVAATTSVGDRWLSSNHGPGISLAAPGRAILSTLNTGTTVPELPGYARYNGTSMAAPHVAGVIALMQSAALRTLSPDAIKQILTTTARALPGTCAEGCGAGIVDAHAAVLKVQEGGTPGPDPDPQELHNGVAVTGLAGKAGSEYRYTIRVPAGSEQLSVSINSGQGNADLYVRYGSPPTDTEYNCLPQSGGNEESCLRILPGLGLWHVRIKAVSDFSGVSLIARYR